MNPYEILDVEKTSSEKDIKKAYRTLAMKHHPDKGGDPDKFKEISQAYETLSNTHKRQSYDNFGSMDLDMDFDPIDIFKVFERDFFGPNRVGAPPFGGFTMFSNQSDQFNGLNMFLGGIGAGGIGLGGIGLGGIGLGGIGLGGIGGMTSFSQTTVIKDGKKITTTTQNGNTTITEESINGRLT